MEIDGKILKWVQGCGPHLCSSRYGPLKAAVNFRVSLNADNFLTSWTFGYLLKKGSFVSSKLIKVKKTFTRNSVANVLNVIEFICLAFKVHQRLIWIFFNTILFLMRVSCYSVLHMNGCYPVLCLQTAKTDEQLIRRHLKGIHPQFASKFISVHWKL